MALKDNADFQLFTVTQVAELFPPADARKKATAHEDNVRELILAHGHYRKFGEQILLTHADIKALFKAIAMNSRASDGQPAPKSDGYVVVLGSRIDPDANVYVGWCPTGGAQRLIDDVQNHASVRTEMLDYAACVYEDFLRVRDVLAKERDYGNWYFRTPETQKLLNEMFGTKTERTDDELQG